MSYPEYQDLFNKCQNNAPYHLFIFDVVNSRNNKDYLIYYPLLDELILRVYKKIQEIEILQNKTILHNSILFYSINDNKITRADLIEPFHLLGDCIGLTIERDSMTSQEVYNLFDSTKSEMNIPLEFHYADGYYETDNYIEGSNKLFRGYAISILMNQHKKEKIKTKIRF